MTKPTHHEDVAVVTLHFHEDELLALAPILAPLAPQYPALTLECGAIARLLLAAGDVLHAQRADRRKA